MLKLYELKSLQMVSQFVLNEKKEIWCNRSSPLNNNLLTMNNNLLTKHKKKKLATRYLTIWSFVSTRIKQAKSSDP